MSGHGRAEAIGDALRVTVEIRSVNHRFCRVSVRTPAELAGFEERVRKLVQDRVQRGKVDVTISVSGTSASGVHLDREIAAAWAKELASISEEHGLAKPSAADLVQLPGVLGAETPDDQDDAADALLSEGVEAALLAFDEMRNREGQDLADDMLGRLAGMRSDIEGIATVADQVPTRIREQLRQRISELLDETSATPDEDRIVQEAAHLAERADVTEEIVRLRSHLDKTETLLTSDEAVGRTLEFVVQEIHRELNTIGSKTKDLGVTDAIVGLKAELERMREQVQNVE